MISKNFGHHNSTTKSFKCHIGALFGPHLNQKTEGNAKDIATHTVNINSQARKLIACNVSFCCVSLRMNPLEI